MNKDCAIVQDLLPSYLENITHEETNEFVKSHLQNCPDCQTLVEELSGDIPIKIDERQTEHEQNLIKRIQRRNYRSIVLSVLVGILLCMFTLTAFRANLFELIIWVYPLVTIILGLISTIILKDVFSGPVVILIVTLICSLFLRINGFWFWILVYFIFSLGGSLVGIWINKLRERGR